MAGYQRVREGWSECRSDEWIVENMTMFYDEVRDRLAELGILSVEQVAEQQSLLRALAPATLPAVWGLYRVTCRAPAIGAA